MAEHVVTSPCAGCALRCYYRWRSVCDGDAWSGPALVETRCGTAPPGVPLAEWYISGPDQRDRWESGDLCICSGSAPTCATPYPPSSPVGPCDDGLTRCWYRVERQWLCAESVWGPAEMVDQGCGPSPEPPGVWTAHETDPARAVQYVRGGVCEEDTDCEDPPVVGVDDVPTWRPACCYTLWQTVFDCVTQTWSAPEMVERVCSDESPPGLGQWVEHTHETAACARRRWEAGEVCSDLEGCPEFGGTPPSVEDLAEEECPGCCECGEGQYVQFRRGDYVDVLQESVDQFYVNATPCGSLYQTSTFAYRWRAYFSNCVNGFVEFLGATPAMPGEPGYSQAIAEQRTCTNGNCGAGWITAGTADAVRYDCARGVWYTPSAGDWSNPGESGPTEDSSLRIWTKGEFGPDPVESCLIKYEDRIITHGSD